MKKLSIVVPAYNEADCLSKFAAAVYALGLPNPLELVFVDDGSSDGTLAEIRRLAADDRVRFVSFSRNFGKEAALLAGLRHATGDLVVTMDADLQHDPALLPAMLRAVEGEGFDCAAACRTSHAGEPTMRGWCAKRFFALMNGCSEVRLREGAMDFRLMTRPVVDAVLSLGEADRFTKGIYEWVGFRTKWIETDNVPRAAGRSKWSFRALAAYSFRGIMAFSFAPLRLPFTFAVLALAGAVAFLAAEGRGGIVGAAMLLACAFLFVSLGVLGLYAAGLIREVRRRPPYIVKEAK